MPGQHKRCSGSYLISQKQPSSTKIKDTSSGRFTFAHPVLPSRLIRMIVYLDFVMAVRFSTHPTRPSSHRPCGCHTICGTTICRYTQLGALTRWERWSSSVKPSEIPCSANALVWYPPSLFRNVQKVAVPVTNEEVWNLLGLVQEEGVDPAAKTKLPQSNFNESLNGNTIQHTYWGLAGCCLFCSWF